MQNHPPIHSEQLAANAFSSQSVVFDALYGSDTMIRYKRDRVRQHIEKYLPGNARILELNAGTGEDALYLAAKGHQVHATDISAGMLTQLANKTHSYNQQERISYKQCSFLSLANLVNKGPYQHIFSNFAGLNCTDDLDKVIASLPDLLVPGGTATLVIMPGFCAWETAFLFRGKFTTAFRRFFAGQGRTAQVAGKFFKCWYYDPAYIRKNTGSSLEIIDIEGLCTIVPPSYIEGFADKYPRLFNRLALWEERYKNRWPFRSIGDYYIVTLKKK